MKPWLRGRKKIIIRFIINSLLCTKNSNHFINPVVIRLYIIVTDRPVIT